MALTGLRSYMMLMLAEDVEEDAVVEEEAVVQDLQNLGSRKLHQ